MKAPEFERWDASRDFGTKSFQSACYAPYVSLEFDTQGFAYTCCANGTYPVGNVRTETLREIWAGGRIAAQREALKKYDLSYGCTVCQWYLANGKQDPLASIYEPFPVASEQPEWPASLAFSFSNQCNLQCVQCSGEYSSSIRIHREHRAPLPPSYSDEFFAQLEEFLPHAVSIRLMGGEPFLVTENYRLFDLLTAAGLTPSIHTTTNGTRFDHRVEEVFSTLPVSVSVSIDGATRETFEASRVGAKFDQVMANTRRFRELTEAAGTEFGINFCLMGHNWQELPDIMALGDELDCWVSIISVHSENFGLHRRPIAELQEVVDSLSARDAEVSARLGRNADNWRNELTQLRSVLADRLAGLPTPMVEPAEGGENGTQVVIARKRVAPARTAIAATPSRQAGGLLGKLRGRLEAHPTRVPAAPPDARPELRAWAVGGPVIAIDSDADDQVTRVSVEGTLPLVDSTDWVGQPFASVIADLCASWGRSVWLVEEEIADGRLNQLIAFSPTPHREKRGVVTRLVTQRAPDGGLRTVIGVDPSFLVQPGPVDAAPV